MKFPGDKLPSDQAKTRPLVLASEALRASEQQYRLLFEQTVDGIFLADAAGRYVDVNTAGCEMLGYSREEVLARTHLDMIEPDEWPRVGPEIARFAGGQVVRSEWRFRRKDGSVFVGEISGRSMPDGRVQGILRDITERKAADTAIRASEARIRAFADAAPAMLWETDPAGQCTFLSREWYAFTGQTEAEALGLGWTDATHSGDQAEARRTFLAANTGREEFRLEYRLRVGGGGYRWALDLGRPRFAATGEYLGMVGVVIDIDERKQAEELLRTSEDRQRLALDAAELGTWNMELATRAVQTDARFQAIFGTTEEFPDFSQLIAIIHPDDVAAVQEAMAAAIRLDAPTSYAIEYRVVHPNGSLRWVLAKGRSSFDGAGPTRRVVSFDGTVADITDRKRSEDALRASEHRSWTILDSITDGFFALDRDWRITYMNAAGARFMDLTPGDLIGKSMWEEFPAMVGSEFERFYRRVAASRVSESLTAHYPDLDRWYEITAYPAPDGLSVYFRDVTDRRQVEQERQQFAALVDASSDFIGVAGLDQRGVYVNRAGQELVGLEPGQVASISILDFFPESERDCIIGLITGSEDRDHVVVDTWFQHLKTAQLIPVSWSFLRLRDASGNVSGYATVTRDLTERTKAENLLRASEEKRRLALDAAELGMWHVDPVTRATTTDARYRAIFGTTEEWTDYLQAVAVIHPDDQPAVLEAVAAATRMEDPAPYAIEYRVIHPDGSLRWILANGRASFEGVGGARRVASFDGTVADITDRKRGEEERERLVARLQEQDQRKDEFLATLAHELRNPLAPIRNALQIMRLAPGDADATERIRLMMERQVGQMVHLIDDLLDMSRISRGMIDLRKQRIELASVIAQAIEASRPSIDQAGHELLIDVPPGPIYVDADLTRLTQVFSNLLNNAAKFTERGGRLRVAVQLVGLDAVVSITDNGIGISTHMLPQVFEMFTQVEGNLERSQGGLGIGLSIVQRLVQMHGGSVEARSGGPGSGSEFLVRLPVALSLVGNQPADEANLVRPTARLRILVADDNLDAAESLAMLLTLDGNETRTAHDGLEALDVAAAFRPDVMLLDIGMPKLNGYEVCRRIRQQAWGQNMVVIALTGWGQEEDKRRSLEAGVDYHLVKPVDYAALEKLLTGVTATRA